MKTDIPQIEKVLTALLAGDEIPKNSLDPKTITMIKKLISDIKSVHPDPNFKAQLLEKINQKLESKTPFWKQQWFKYSASSVAVACIAGLVILPMIQDPTQDSVYDQKKDKILPGKKEILKQKPQASPVNKGLISSADDLSQIAGATSSERRMPSFLKNRKEEKKAFQEQELALPAGIALDQAYYDNSAEDMYYLPPVIEQNRGEKYAQTSDNAPKKVSQEPVSTFSIDVDTASYSNVRRFIQNGQTAPKDAVRIEEMINYFSYDYDLPTDKSQPFSLTTEIGPNPWNENTNLLHIGIKGYEKAALEETPSNLVFLIDTSGSMSDANKLPLLKQSMKLLAQNMKPSDRLSIVTYAGSTSIVLDGADGNDLEKVEQALKNLNSGGSTAGAAGIDLAYETAEKHFNNDGINRILLATDGDFNVGISDIEELKKVIENKRENGISLTTLGFGQGNYNDHLMEQLADTGNGNYAYIDSLLEAQKVLVTEGASTLETIAKDVKIQIEFNPSLVSEYRLIGYENRHLNREDFDNDVIDAGEIGSGHTVTAVYEIALAGQGGEQLPNLRYQTQENTKSKKERVDPSIVLSNELGFLKVRYKEPRGSVSKLIEVPMQAGAIIQELSETSDNYRFSAAVAAFGQILRESKYINDFDYDDIVDLARNARGEDFYGYRSEFLQLVPLAESIQ